MTSGLGGDVLGERRKMLRGKGVLFDKMYTVWGQLEGINCDYVIGSRSFAMNIVVWLCVKAM
jgi:hypothetical protein